MQHAYDIWQWKHKQINPTSCWHLGKTKSSTNGTWRKTGAAVTRWAGRKTTMLRYELWKNGPIDLVSSVSWWSHWWDDGCVHSESSVMSHSRSGTEGLAVCTHELYLSTPATIIWTKAKCCSSCNTITLATSAKTTFLGTGFDENWLPVRSQPNKFHWNPTTGCLQI